MIVVALMLVSLASAVLAWWADAPPVSAAAVFASWLAFTVAVVRHHVVATSGRSPGSTHGMAHADAETVLVAFASQAGFAEQLAGRTAASLAKAGVDVRLMSCAEVDRSVLAHCRRALFVVSTTGEGDAPDSAAGLARGLAAAARGDGLGQLRFGILALGDRNYARFCAFGHTLSSWLERTGATPMFELVEVDKGDAGALRHWQKHLSALAGGADIADWERPRHGRWILRERRLLNAGSAGAPAFHLALEPADPSDASRPSSSPAPDWVAGDIAEIGARHAPAEIQAWLAELGVDGAQRVRCDGADLPLADALATKRRLPLPRTSVQGVDAQTLVDALPTLPHREYSISSLPGDGRLELLVRQARRADGSLGLASGWLTAYAAVGDTVALRVRQNRAFHAPDGDGPMVLIGNGTGLAGLRAHLKARAAAGRHRNWLLFGERNAAVDAFHAEELAAWQSSGVLERLDLIWSRDGGAWRYVQDAIAGQAGAIREWVEAGAAIYVSGSLEGMAAGVDAALAEAIGAARLAALREAGRYRRDVY